MHKMTLEEKYQRLCDALRAMIKRSEGCYYCDPYSANPAYYDGKDAGIESMADDAREALESVGEKVK